MRTSRTLGKIALTAVSAAAILIPSAGIAQAKQPTDPITITTGPTSTITLEPSAVQSFADSHGISMQDVSREEIIREILKEYCCTCECPPDITPTEPAPSEIDSDAPKPSQSESAAPKTSASPSESQTKSTEPVPTCTMTPTESAAPTSETSSPSESVAPTATPTESQSAEQSATPTQSSAPSTDPTMSTSSAAPKSRLGLPRTGSDALTGLAAVGFLAAAGGGAMVIRRRRHQ